MPDKKMHLVCNAHMDPVWLWEWEEGAAATISTFRCAADFCEEFDGFIFNHNEAVLYRWVEEYEPALFRRIQRLVRQKKWHIMGGWYLQPDCNMPSGESFVRQILTGRRYFEEKFGAAPTTAINLDPFGHTQGLVQILAKSGYDSYLFCRPDQKDCPLPDADFVWVGYDGSEVMASRVVGWYNSQLGKARKKIEDRIKSPPFKDNIILLWGLGDHGGGPTRVDLTAIAKFIRERKDWRIIHSTPETYFAELKTKRPQLPRHAKDMNPWGVGCYTSQVRIKQRHRRLENELYATEKMATAAAVQGLMEYPRADLDEALRDLMFSEFHDILPGSSIQPVEEAALRLMDHGLEILSRVKARTFFALAAGQSKAKDGEIPILVHNPHPYRVRTIVECEFQLADPNWDDVHTTATVYRDGKAVRSQVEKELSNLHLDWRKRIAFAAELEPGQMNRYDCRLKVLRSRPKPALKEKNGTIRFKTASLDVVINARTGLVDRYRVRGVDHVGPNAFEPLVMTDNEDSWGMLMRGYRKIAGRFKLMSRREGTRFSGVTAGQLPSVRVIEDGALRTIVEAVLQYGDSFICQQYKLPKEGTEIEVETRVHWNEKNRMLKLSVPVSTESGRYVGQVAYGVGELPSNGDEAVAQKWVAVISKDEDKALTCINEGVYGSDYSSDGLRLTLLRSPAYSGHPIYERPIVVQDRYLPRIDQGERVFRFWFNGGPAGERLDVVDREALARNERPFALSFFPPGVGKRPTPVLVLSDEVVQVTAIKKAADNDDLIIRLFEPTGNARSTVLSFPLVPMKAAIRLGGFEIRTLRVNLKARKVAEVNLLEKVGGGPEGP
jgi:alpha-mannosidase